jgi:hypothetical protein
MRISQRIKSLFRRQPPTAEELAARREAESIRVQSRPDEAAVRNEVDARTLGGGQF